MPRLTDAELRVMEVLWQQGPLPAAEIARALAASEKWSRNTSYTLLSRCIEKGAVSREDPGFHCRALTRREDVRQKEVSSLLETMFEGSREMLFASMLSGRKLTREEAARLHAMIDTTDMDTEGGEGR